MVRTLIHGTYVTSKYKHLIEKMLVTVVMHSFPAPGLSNRTLLSSCTQFSKTVKLSIDVDPTATVGSKDLFTNAMTNAPADVKASLIYLRTVFKGKEIDLTKSFQENSLAEGNEIILFVLVN